MISDQLPPQIVCPPSLVHPLVSGEQYTLEFGERNYPPDIVTDDSGLAVQLRCDLTSCISVYH